MKKYIIVAALIFAVSFSAASAQAFTFTKDLKIGSSGSDIGNLQTLLINKGFDIPAISSGVSGKGYFGAQTRVAVAKFQASVELPSTGYVGSLTREKLNQIDVSSSTNPMHQITITLPKGGEQWEVNSVHGISWNITGDIKSSDKIDIYLVSLQPCPAHRLDGTIVGCFPANTIASIAKSVPANIPYQWTVGTDISSNTFTKGTLPNQTSLTEIKVCIADTSNCGYSDSGFTIIPAGYGANKPPVINSLSGPTTASVG